MNTVDKELERKVRLNKIQSELRNEAKISECFHFDKYECKGKIKNAHSIQRNGRLSLLEEDINGNKKIYSLSEIEPVGVKEYRLKPIGKAIASTFMGFCDFHDTMLLSTIENQPFQSENDEHCFLHSYRAFAIAQHRKKEQIKAFMANIEFNKIMGHALPKSLEGTLIGYEEGEAIKAKLNNVLMRKAYEELVYLEIQYPKFYPVASSSSMTPTHSPKTNTELNIRQEFSTPYQHVFFNLLPDEQGSIVILSCFPDDQKSVQYIDEFDFLPDLKQKKVLTSILIGYVENTFMSPLVYNRMSDREKNILIKELHDTNIFSATP